MSLAGIKASNPGNDRRDEQAQAVREEAFQRRVSAQQHLRFNGPLLRALIEVSGGLDFDYRPGEFERRVLQARGIAVRIAANVLRKEERDVSLEEARHYRQDCAEAVAWSWRAGVELDENRFVAEVLAAMKSLDGVYDADTMPWRQITPNGNMALTVFPAAMKLRSVVEDYDFRIGKEEVLGVLVEVVSEMANEAVQILLPEKASVADRRSLFQSVLREYAWDLRSLYEQEARRTVAKLKGTPEPEREAYLKEARPLDSVVEAFRGVARRNTALTAGRVYASMEGALPSQEPAPGA